MDDDMNPIERAKEILKSATIKDDGVRTIAKQLVQIYVELKKSGFSDFEAMIKSCQLLSMWVLIYEDLSKTFKKKVSNA